MKKEEGQESQGRPKVLPQGIPVRIVRLHSGVSGSIGGKQLDGTLSQDRYPGIKMEVLPGDLLIEMNGVWGLMPKSSYSIAVL